MGRHSPLCPPGVWRTLRPSQRDPGWWPRRTPPSGRSSCCWGPTRLRGCRIKPTLSATQQLCANSQVQFWQNETFGKYPSTTREVKSVFYFIYIHIYIYINIFIFMYTYMCVYMYVYIHTYYIIYTIYIYSHAGSPLAHPSKNLWGACREGVLFPPNCGRLHLKEFPMRNQIMSGTCGIPSSFAFWVIRYVALLLLLLSFVFLFISIIWI